MGMTRACTDKGHGRCENPRSCECPCHKMRFEEPPRAMKSNKIMDGFAVEIDMLRSYPGRWIRLANSEAKSPTTQNRRHRIAARFNGLEVVCRLTDPGMRALWVRWPVPGKKK